MRRGGLVPTAPALGRWMLGSQGSEVLSASQVAVNGGEGWDAELMELFGAAQPAAVTC